MDGVELKCQELVRYGRNIVLYPYCRAHTLLLEATQWLITPTLPTVVLVAIEGVPEGLTHAGHRCRDQNMFRRGFYSRPIFVSYLALLFFLLIEPCSKTKEAAEQKTNSDPTARTQRRPKQEEREVDCGAGLDARRSGGSSGGGGGVRACLAVGCVVAGWMPAQQQSTRSDGPRGAIAPASDKPKQEGRGFDCGAEQQ